MTKKKISTKKVVKGLLFGSLVGGTTALLLAPRSGKETQEKLTKEAKDSINLVTEVKNNAEEVQLNAAHLHYLTETLLPEFVEETNKSVKNFQFRNKYRLEDIKKQVAIIQKEMETFSEEMEQELKK